MKKLFIFLIIFFGFIFSAKASLAANHFIRDGATGTSCADWSTACDSLPANLIRGDTYYIADGIYGSYTFDDAVSGTSVITIKKAIASDHGMETGWNSTYGDGEAVFSATDTVWTFNTGYYDINGIVGQGKSQGTYGFRVYSSASRSGTTIMVVFGAGTITNVAWRHIDFDWNNGSASGSSGVTRHFFTLGSSDYITIENSYFHHSSGYVFYIGGYDPNPGGLVQNHYTIRNNYFYMNGGGGSDSAHWETFWLMNVDNSNIYNNVFEDTIGSAGQTGWVMMAKANNVNVYGNLFFCSGSASACIVGGNGVVATWSADVYKNDAVNIYNNTFANLRGVYTPQIYFIHNSVSDTNITVKNNLYYNTAFNWAGINTHSHEACGGGQGCAGTSQQTGITTSKFLNYSANNFHLGSATLAGDNTIGAQFNSDTDNTIRGLDGTWDRGAFEYVSGSPGNTAPAIPTGVKVI